MYDKNELNLMRALGKKSLAEIPALLKAYVEGYEETLDQVRGRRTELSHELLALLIYLFEGMQKEEPKEEPKGKASTGKGKK